MYMYLQVIIECGCLIGTRKERGRPRHLPPGESMGCDSVSFLLLASQCYSPAF